MFPSGSLRGVAGTCGRAVLEIVSPALPDDPKPPSTSPSANVWSQSGMSWSRWPEVVDGRSPETASASLQKLVSTIPPSTTSSANFPN